MPDEIDKLDLSEFGLAGDAPAPPASPAAALSDGNLSPEVLTELGLEDFSEPAAATNGQAPVADLPDLDYLQQGESKVVVREFYPEPPAGSSVTSSPQHVLQPTETEVFGENFSVSPSMPPQGPHPVPHQHAMSLPDYIGPASSPSTGFGILEQIVLELTRLNMELAGLRQRLSTPGVAGSSDLARLQEAQNSAPSADTASRPRRRGRPKKEEESETDDQP